MSLLKIRDKIQNKTAQLGVIGLGYVGLPLACLFAEAGFEVIGVDIQPDRVAQINHGHSPFNGIEPGLPELLASVVTSRRFRATTNYESLKDCDVIFINVETPVDENHIPRYEALRNVLTHLGLVLSEGTLVVVESTIAPGTMAEIVQPLLEASSGKRANEGFFLGHCPERVMTGKLLKNLRTVSRVVGGLTPETAETMIRLYRHIVQADLDPSDCVIAELVKTAENAYRDVNIAFANEVALICEAVGGDVQQVRTLLNKSPGRNMLLPGAGVGGHCIPKDPWLLAYRAQDKAPIRLIPAARAVNEYMPLHMVELYTDVLSELGQTVHGSRVLVLGYAYLENADDTRDSPTKKLINHLDALGIEAVIHDPWVKGYEGDPLELARECDGVILMVKHQLYFDLDLEALGGALKTPILVDGRHVFTREEAEKAGFVYRGLGQGAVDIFELVEVAPSPVDSDPKLQAQLI